MSSHLVHVPAEDLTRQYQQIRWEIAAAIDTVLPSGKYTLGPILETFEQEFADYCGCKYCIGISNGTEALHLALAALGVGPGDEVITQANTYVATAFAVNYLGATPVFVDIEPCHANIAIEQVEARITPRTKAIIPVHMYGHPTDMHPLLELAQKYELKVLEDASHAHGATYKGQRIGSLGDAAAFSFYPTKNLGCYGDGGIITTDSEKIYEKAMMLRTYGQSAKHVHAIEGFNSRLDEVQAALLDIKLEQLDYWNKKRRHIAWLYKRELGDAPILLPLEEEWAYHVYHLYVIRVKERDELMKYLKEKGVSTLIHYPTAIHMQTVYKHLGYKEGAFPNAEKAAKEIISLPIYPSMKEDEVVYVSKCIREFYGMQG